MLALQRTSRRRADSAEATQTCSAPRRGSTGGDFAPLLLPDKRRLQSLGGAVGEIVIHQVLVRDTRFLGQFLEVVNGIRIYSNRDCLLQLADIGIPARPRKIVLFAHINASHIGWLPLPRLSERRLFGFAPRSHDSSDKQAEDVACCSSQIE